MTAELFSQWLVKLDRKFAAQNRKVALILDNCTAHPKTALEFVTLFFLPPNTTNVLQPCDQGIIKHFKHHYRKIILQKYLSSIELNETLPKISILDALYFMESAWDKVTKSTIEHCFHHSGFQTTEHLPLSSIENDMNSDDIFEVTNLPENLPNGVTFEDYVSVDDGIITTEFLSDADIIHMVQNHQNLDDETYESEEEDVLSIPSNESVESSLNIIRRFLQSKENSTDVYRNLLHLENCLKMI